ncbi:ABC transporter permease [Lacticaseibacillus parakribbianus]|uniref:ABC transporter permease n=1 Tax=Lacticaseibacillus parakribbianus TaxID=2970927 RepID=UPI0021CB20F3|nr:ABC transporter permease subunit [Lacticaseibacillus parakribbianus]
MDVRTEISTNIPTSRDLRTREIRRKFKTSLPLYVLLLPSLILLVIFAYFPIYGLIMAFQDYSPILGISGSPFVGLDNFKQYFNSYQFLLTIKNTLVLSVYSLIVNTPLPVALAIMCNQIRREGFKKVFQVVTYLPHFISTMVMCGMILLFLSPQTGLLANFLHLFGVKLPDIMSNASNFAHVYVWSDVWQHVGWNSIIYIAALSAIDPTYYEAATMDGATVWQKIVRIDLPLILPTMMILLIMSVGNLLNVGFEKVLLLQNSLNLSHSEIISTYVYKIGLQDSQYSLSTAIGLFNTLINGTLLIAVNWLSKKLTNTGLF